MPAPRISALALTLALVLSACRLAGAPPSPTPSQTAFPSGIPVDELGNVDVSELREALLGEPPYPSGWEAQVDEMVANVERLLEGMRVPDVRDMDAEEAACTVWQPMVGNTDWATGAFLERQNFIAHVAMLAQVAPADIGGAAAEALEISAAAAAEQMTPDGDSRVISRFPHRAVETIGLWAVEHCELPIETDEPPNVEGWTDEEVAQSCTLDREWLVDAQEEYRTGPGDGRYAEHPHALEVTLEIFVYPAWHRLAAVDNASDPPTFAVEPIPGAFCDV